MICNKGISCRLSFKANQINNKMKFLVLALCVVAAFADPHWVMLDSSEVGYVKSSWDQIKFSEMDILYYIFKEYPDIMNKFPQFNGKSLDSLKGTPEFAIHATRIVSFFSQYILLLGKESSQPCIKTILNDMAKNHMGRGVTKDQFNEFRTAMFGYLKAHVT